MDAQKRFLRFKLAATGTALLGLGALAYSQGWISLAQVNDPQNGITRYVTWPGHPSPEQAAEALVKSMDRFQGDIQGPYFEKVVNKVLERSSAPKRSEIIRGLEAYLVQDPDLMAGLAKHSVESNAISESDTTYLVRRGFDNLGADVQRETLLDLYKNAEVETQVCLVEQGLAEHPGSIAKGLASRMYNGVRTSLKDAGDWTFNRGEEE